MANNAENVSIWWRHHVLCRFNWPIWAPYIAFVSMGNDSPNCCWSVGWTNRCNCTLFLIPMRDGYKCTEQLITNSIFFCWITACWELPSLNIAAVNSHTTTVDLFSIQPSFGLCNLMHVYEFICVQWGKARHVIQHGILIDDDISLDHNDQYRKAKSMLRMWYISSSGVRWGQKGTKYKTIRKDTYRTGKFYVKTVSVS